ncbi:MAG: nucleoside monophosphate kinase [Candidatus Saliniplasma sp.]
MTWNVPDELTNVIVTGKSGAGKQPRIDVLVKVFDLEQLSTGNIFRKYLGKFDDFGYDDNLDEFWDGEDFIPDNEIAKKLGTKDESIILGMKAKYFVEQGRFVPDRITNQLFKSYFEDRGYADQVLDGYPRTLSQSKFILDLAEEKDTTIDFVVWVENSDELIIERTTKRRICPECGKVYHLKYDPPTEDNKCKECGIEVIQRSDDTEGKIRSRLEEFKEKTIPALKYLEENGIPIAKVPGHLEEFTPENVKRSVMEEIEKLYR